jgi:hypothetical protein
MLAALLCCVMLFASCKKDENTGSAACNITLFSVNSLVWTIDDTEITRVYPPETAVTPLAPEIITLSPGATVNPPAGEMQDFFTEQGVTYTVTAEDGVTKKTYTAKAIRTQYKECEMLSFTVDSAKWIIDGTSVSYLYPMETEIMPLTPVITLSPGARVDPPSGVAQDLFATQGVTYTVTSEDGAMVKTYTARASRIPSLSCDIVSFTVDGTAWTINGMDITRVYPSDTPETPFTPVIVVSPGAEVNPPSGEEQNFFAAQGVTYIVTSENGVTQKTYIARAIIHNDHGNTGECTWELPDVSDSSRIAISGDGAMEDYNGTTLLPPWSPYRLTIQTVEINEGVTTVGKYAFNEYVNLASLTIPNSVTAIGSSAFMACTSLETVTIPDLVKTVGEFAFYSCSALTYVTIGNSVTNIQLSAFSNCENLTYLTFGNSVSTIGATAFFKCISLTSLTIPNTVTSIGSQAFYDCSGLTTVTIGNSVTSIGDEAFNYCPGLTEVINLNPTPQRINSNVFGDLKMKSITLKVPASSVDSYKAANVWKEFEKIEPIY